jgi:excisionase family DNA binding protein
MFTDKMLKTFARELAPAVAEVLRKHLTPRIAPRYMNYDQVAEYLNTTADAVRGMARAKNFPVRKIGTRVFIDVKDIDKAMSNGEQWLN